MAARFRLRKTAAWHDITKWRAYIGGVWREIIQVRRYTKTGPNTFAWKTVYLKPGQAPPVNPPPVNPPSPPPAIVLTVTISPSPVSAAITGTGTVTTNNVVATAKKGTAPYTYQWSRVSWDAPVAPTFEHPSQQTTKISQVITAAPPTTYTARVKCTAKDVNGNKGSKTVDITFYGLQATTAGGTPINPDDYYNLDGTEIP